MTSSFLLMLASDLGVQCCIIPIVSILIYLIWEGYTRSKKAAHEEEIRSQAEESERKRVEDEKQRYESFVDSATDLFNSSHYRVLEQFSRKFYSVLPEQEVENLRLTLERKGYRFSRNEILQLVEQEHFRQRSNDLKVRILSQEPYGARGLIEAYLGFCTPSDGQMIIVLRDILEERSLFQLFDSNIENLRQEVKRVAKEIELENFEKRLLEGSPIVSVAQVDGMTGYEFEDFLRELFVRMGYNVVQTRLSGDQGADIVAEKNGERVVVQAKRYEGNVGNYAVQEIVAAMSLYGAHAGKVITNSFFTRSAEELAVANNIHLVDRDELESLINSYW